MLSSEQKRELKLKSVNNVKRLNPGFKRIAVYLINKVGRLLFIFRRNIIPADVKKILFISLSFYGDILLQSPLFELVRKLHPDAVIHIWIKSRTKEIIKGYPYISKVHVFDDVRTRRYDEEVKPGISHKLNFFRKLRKENYDLVFDLTGLIWTAIGAYMVRPKYSSGYNFLGLGFLYNFESEAIYKGHLIDKHMNLVLLDPLYENELKKLGPFSVKPVYYVSEESRKKIDDLYTEQNITIDRKKVALHTTAGWQEKKWDISNFVELSNILAGNFDIVLIGGKEDVSNAELICKESKAKVYNFAGNLTIGESAEVIRRSDLFIGADSGPLYVAEAVGTLTLSLFGPTNPWFSAPRGEIHEHIYYKLFCSADEDEQNCKLMAGLNCRSIDCMKMITPADVADRVFRKFKVH